MRLAFSTGQAKIFGEQIFAGTNFRNLAFDRENRKNFPLYGTFHGPYFHFCLELALELTHSLWVHDLGHTHSLVSIQ